MNGDRCPRCGAPVGAGKRFCPACGQPVAEAAAPIPVQPAVAPQGAPKSRWLRNSWDVFSIAGCGAVSAGWLWYSGLAETSPDYKTCAAIALAPVATVLFRNKLRQALRPLSGLIGRVPFLLRLGVSLAAPYLIASTLYGKGISEFPFMYKTTAYSMLLSGLLLHTPAPRPSGGGK